MGTAMVVQGPTAAGSKFMEVHRELYCGRYWVVIYSPTFGVHIFSGLTEHEASKKADQFVDEHKEIERA